MSPDTLKFVNACQQPERLAKLGSQVVEAAGDLGPRGLADDKVMMADTFQQFADDVVAPLAERIHREDEIIPRCDPAGTERPGLLWSLGTRAIWWFVAER